MPCDKIILIDNAKKFLYNKKKFNKGDIRHVQRNEKKQTAAFSTGMF